MASELKNICVEVFEKYLIIYKLTESNETEDDDGPDEVDGDSLIRVVDPGRLLQVLSNLGLLEQIQDRVYDRLHVFWSGSTYCHNVSAGVLDIKFLCLHRHGSNDHRQRLEMSLNDGK